MIKPDEAIWSWQEEDCFSERYAVESQVSVRGLELNLFASRRLNFVTETLKQMLSRSYLVNKYGEIRVKFFI